MDGNLRPYDPGPHGPYGPGMGGSRAAREAARRNLERGVRSFLIRLRRAGFTFVALFSALVVYMIVYGFIGIFTLMFALAGILLLSMLVMTFPVRDRRPKRPPEGAVVDGGTAARLDVLTHQTEEWLVERCRALPSQAGPALDRIVFRLRDLAPSLATVPADTALGGEAKRLIGEHLPNLVTTYLSLPPGERSFYSDTSERLSESLGIVADQMDDLCERVAQERRMGFETERRFIESRYSDDENLKLGRPR